MEIIRIKRKVKSTLLKIKELDRFKGKNIELEIKVKELKAKESKNKVRSIAGIFAKYSDISLISKENTAWELAVREKHDNYRC